MRILLAVSLAVLTLGIAGAAHAETCLPGDWTIVSGEPNEAPVRYETAHFAFRWKDNTVKPEDAKAAGVKLEEIWDFYMGPVAFAEPYCDTAKKHKANINLDPT
jgi:hypothetical protein